VANCEVMLADIKERDAFNEVYKKYWEPGKFPARHAFGVTACTSGRESRLPAWP
jgi:2-iminobutanoate/2-iminopropanoate deaminase